VLQRTGITVRMAGRISGGPVSVNEYLELTGWLQGAVGGSALCRLHAQAITPVRDSAHE